MSTVIANSAALDKLKRDLLRLPSVSRRIADQAAPLMSGLARADFDARRSPYGNSWAQGVTLNRSGRLRSGAVGYTSTGSVVRASVGAVPYARYQLKHGYLPARGAIPAKWLTALSELTDVELTKALGQ